MKLKELKALIESGDDDMEVSFPEQKKEPILVNYETPSLVPIEGAVANFKHSCNLGDIIASLICVKKYYELTGRKVRFIQTIGMKAAYYQGAVHGTVDDKGEMVTLNSALFDMIKPLLESQPYIERMEVYNGQSIHIDFDVIRGKTFVNMPHGSIQGWLMYAFPDLASDISKSWITLDSNKKQIEDVTKGKVVINFTERYRNTFLDYFFLQKYAPDLIFAGTEKEHWLFCSKWGLNIPRLEVKDFLELAYAIRGCKFLLSNQSMCWNLSTALGTPRLLEVCQFAQNCLPFYGDHNNGFFHQVGLEYLFRDMYAKCQ